MIARPTLALLLCASSLLPAARAADPPARAFELERVLHDEPGDGRLWARGASWKASFAPDATTYYPLFGERAERHYPLVLRVAEVALGGEPLAFDAAARPTREGDTLRYARGSFTEVFETGLESIEQLFVFDELRREGELVIRVALETELAARDEAQALVFENEHGRVQYSRAVALDARGERVDAPTVRTAEGVEIRVPADFVARARLPLVVDPVIATYGLELPNDSARSVDVAFDAATNSFLHVFQVSSNGDLDVLFLRVSADSLTDPVQGVIDASPENWTTPRVASLPVAGTYLVVATVVSMGAEISVRGRRVPTSGGGLPPAFRISPEGSASSQSADVGGSRSGHHWAVVWQSLGASGWDILARRVHESEALDDVVPLDVSTADDRSPSISRSLDGEWWNVVWERHGSAAGVWGRRMDRTGSPGGASFLIAPGSSREPRASTTSDDGTWLAVFERYGLPYTFGSQRMSGESPVLDTMLNADLHHQLLTLFHARPDVHRGRPDVDCDGSSFVVSWTEETAPDSNQHRVQAMTVATVGPHLRVAEVQGLPFVTPQQVGSSLLALRGAGGPDRRFVLAAPSPAGGQQWTIQGVLYDAAQIAPLCIPGYDVGPCPCDNPPSEPMRGCDNSAATGGARLAASGVASVSSDSLRLHAADVVSNSLNLFVQGRIQTSGAPFGAGLSCVGGQLLPLYVKTDKSGSTHAPLETEPRISERSSALGDAIAPGATRYYFVLYRDHGVQTPGSGGGLSPCMATSVLNTTPTLQVVWAP